jgi:hypothetical protein
MKSSSAEGLQWELFQELIAFDTMCVLCFFTTVRLHLDFECGDRSTVKMSTKTSSPEEL